MFNFIKTGVSRIYGVTEDKLHPQQTADMDSMPDLLHSDEFSTSSHQRMSSDSNSDDKTKPLEDHKALIPSYGNQLKQDQLLRQQEYQARVEQEQLEHHLRHLEGLQQQQRVGAAHIASPVDYLHSPQSPFSPVGVGGGDLETEQKQQEQLYRYHQLYQQQLMQEQHRQQEQQQQQQQFHQQQQQQQQYAQGGGQYDAPGTDMPSLSFSDNSSAASFNMQSAYHGPSQPMPAGPGANIGGAGGIFDMAAAAGLGGGGVNGGAVGGGAVVPGEAAVAGGGGGGGGGGAAPQFLDHELFLTSVLNAIAPWMDGDDASGNRLEQVDYQSEFTQRQMLAVGGNGEIRKAFWGSRNVFVVLKSLLDSKHHTAAKNASMFDKEVSIGKEGSR